MYPKSFRYKLGCGLSILLISLLIIFSISTYTSWHNKESSTSPSNTVAENQETTLLPTYMPTAPPIHPTDLIHSVKITATLMPTPSPTPSPTTPHTKPNPSPTRLPNPTPLPTANTILVNGLSPETFIYLPPETIQHCQKIFAQGAILERDPHQFSKVGDSILDTEQFFAPFDDGNYQLGDYQYLEHVIAYYAGEFGRSSVALRDGLNSTSVMDPMWANKAYCLANEMPLACEIRLNNPSLILIHFGTNDWTHTYESNMRQIIEFSIKEGIVPILITKANRIDKTNKRNDILHQLAAEYHIPLWDFDLIANTLPDRGLAQDDAHLSVANNFDYSDTQYLTEGYKAFNLTGLMLLDAFLREIVYNDK